MNNNYWIQGQIFQKLFPKKVVYKAGEFLGNKIADAVTEPTDDKIAKPDENLEEIIIPLEKRGEILNKLRKVMEHYKISKSLNNSIVSKFVTKNGSK